MAEFKRLPTQEELSRMLYQMQLGGKSQQEIINENLASGTKVNAIPENVFQKMAGGAQIAKEQVNKLGNAADLAKLFPGYTGQSQVSIPTGYNFAPKQDVYGGVTPQGLQTQQVNVNQLLQAIKPADVLGITGAQQAYTDVGMGKAPNPMDVLDIAGLGAAGAGAGKGLLKVAEATKGLPVGMSIKDVSSPYNFDKVFHGGASKVSIPDLSKSGSVSGIKEEGSAFWVTPSKESAKNFGNLASKNPIVSEFSFSPKNPLVVDYPVKSIFDGSFEKLKIDSLNKARLEGNDSVIFKQMGAGEKLLEDEIAIIDTSIISASKKTKGLPVGMSIQDVSKPAVNLQTLANEAMWELRANPTAANKEKYIAARDAAANEFVALRDKPEAPQIAQESIGYQGQHTAPMKDSGKPLWDLSGVYPEDFYSSQGARYYGHGEDLARDSRIVSQIQSFKGRPDRPVTVYRAVPKDVPKGTGINKGDWITTDLQYAKEHGKGSLGGDYKIIKKTVKARDIFTNGDSIYEFGYDPQEYVPKSQR